MTPATMAVAKERGAEERAVDGGDPLGGAGQLDVRVDDVSRFAVRDDALSRGQRVHGTAADRLGGRGMPLAGIALILAGIGTL